MSTPTQLRMPFESVEVDQPVLPREARQRLGKLIARLLLELVDRNDNAEEEASDDHPKR